MNPNQFEQSVVLGAADLRFNSNTLPAQIDMDQATALKPGQAVKIVDSAGGVPKVIAVDADSDEVFGFISYAIKDAEYKAGESVQVASASNCIYLKAQGAIARGAQVCVHASVLGEVKALTDGANIVGYAYDKAANGDLFRVILSTPSFSVYTA